MKNFCVLLTGFFAFSILVFDAQAQQQNAAKSSNVKSTAGSYQLAAHPRLFFSRGEEETVLEKAKKHKLLSELIEVLKIEADKELQSMPQVYKPGVQLLATSREQIKRLVTLSMAYRLFKDDRYARKAEEEILNVCRFNSWHPEHFLDVAEMTTAVAIGYDWCYDFISEATRKIAEDAIREKGFAPAWPIYETTDKKTPFNRENNWNMVCNAGMVNGAIAIGDKYPAELKRIIDYAVKYTPNLLESFAPEGVFNEGPGYWAYNGMYMSLLFDNLKRNIGNDFGLPGMKGLENTARFYMSIVGPTDQPFNFGDASEGVDRSGTFFYLSKQYQQPEVASFYKTLISSGIKKYRETDDFRFPRFFFLAIPWFDDAVSKGTNYSKLETFEGVTDFIILNGSPDTDAKRFYLAAKTGKPSWSHNQLDVGSFVVESQGERWGIDLGAETYSLPSFWDYKPYGIRWNYFRNSNLSHNTLSIDDKITNSDGQGELTKSNKKGSKPFGIFDITSAYQREAGSVLRGFKLLSPRVALIRDELTLKPGSEKVSWRFVTHADVKINGNTAILTQNGKTFYIQSLIPGTGTMQTVEAKPYTAAEKPIKGVTIVEISVMASGDSVSIPVLIGDQLNNFKLSAADNVALSKWK